MNPNTPRNAADFADRIELHHRRVSKTLVARITELAEGLSPHEIAAHLGVPIALVNLALRGATLGDHKR